MINGTFWVKSLFQGLSDKNFMLRGHFGLIDLMQDALWKILCDPSIQGDSEYALKARKLLRSL